MTPAHRQKRVWTEREEKILLIDWGILGIDKLAKKLNRSMGAVQTRAFELGLRNKQHGLLTLHQFVLATGYHISTVRIALKAVRIHLKPIPPATVAEARRLASVREHYRKGLDEDQQARLTEWLLAHNLGDITPRKGLVRAPLGVWGVPPHPTVCQRCLTTDSPYCSKGICRRCYNRAQRQKRRDLVPRTCLSPRPC